MNMTETEHRKIATALRGKITKARNAAKAPMVLADKLQAQKVTKELEQRLHDHQLNFFELTK